VTGPYKTINPGFIRAYDCPQWWLDFHVVREHGKVLYLLFLSSYQGNSGRGGGSFKPDSKENNLLIRVFFRNFEGVQGRIDETYITSSRPRL